jgi:hypothetical protein
MAPKPATRAQPIERSLRSARLIAVVWLLAVAWLLAVDWRLLKPGALGSPRDHACFAGQVAGGLVFDQATDNAHLALQKV